MDAITILIWGYYTDGRMSQLIGVMEWNFRPRSGLVVNLGNLRCGKLVSHRVSGPGRGDVGWALGGSARKPRQLGAAGWTAPVWELCSVPLPALPHGRHAAVSQTGFTDRVLLPLFSIVQLVCSSQGRSSDISVFLRTPCVLYKHKESLETVKCRLLTQIPSVEEDWVRL